MKLLDRAKAAPKYSGQKCRQKWSEYVEPFWILVNEKGYSKTAACEWLAKEANLSKSEATKLRNAAGNWKQN